MGKAHTFSTEAGEELVVLSRRDYDALLARAGEEPAEDAMTVLLVAESREAIARGAESVLPATVWDAIEGGANPVRAIRKHRGLTQAQLARHVGIRQAFLSEIETGRKSGTTETLKAIARALGVSLDDLAG